MTRIYAIDIFSSTYRLRSITQCASLKTLSDCHEFGYDMRRVKNSPHVVWKSKRCRPTSAVLVTCRHISYIVGESLRDFLKNLATTRRPKWAELFSYWSRNSSVDCRTFLVHISPIVVDSRVFWASCRPWRHSASYDGSRTTCCDTVRYNAEIWRVYYGNRSFRTQVISYPSHFVPFWSFRTHFYFQFGHFVPSLVIPYPFRVQFGHFIPTSIIF